ncbi:hypothetical protein JTB14_026103 [Gonioctena quinquepunctata]|nr:hypothetical protein JTB14_026103 [Gonioctena quinquepunctata]
MRRHDLLSDHLWSSNLLNWIQEDAAENGCQSLLAEALTLYDGFQKKLGDSADPGNLVPVGLRIIQKAIGGSQFQTSIQHAPSSSSRAMLPVSRSSTTIKMTPPLEWGSDELTGYAKSVSISASF